MDISQSALAWLYFDALLLGIGLGALYDLFRLTRVFLGVHYSRRAARRLQEMRLPLLTPYKKHAESRALGVVVFFEDLFFCLAAGVALVLLFYEANNGKFRFPVLIAAAAGFLLYRGTLGRIVMLFSEVIAFLIETACRYLVFFLLFPFRTVGRWAGAKVKSLVGRTVRLQNKRHRRRFTAAECGRADRNACGMIPTELPKNKMWKRGKQLGKSKQKTVQPHISDARAARRSRSGGDRRIRQ